MKINSLKINQKGRILAIDYGRKKIGLAVTDETQIAITRLFQLNQFHPDFWKKLSNTINSIEPVKIILGIPGDPKIDAISREILDFRQYIFKRFPDIEILLWDESYSSIEAEGVLEELKIKRKHKKKEIDSMSAAILLKRYMAKNDKIH